MESEGDTHMSNIAQLFNLIRREGRSALITYLTVGYPDVAATLELAPALERGGADIIELGVPFSDPLADGATIQRASHHALRQGVTLSLCLDIARQLRNKGMTCPIILMSYFNPLLSYGLDRLAAKAAEVGVDGFIVPDLPPEEAGDMLQSCRPRGLDLVFLLAPTSTDERIDKVSQASSGFIYCVSLTGVTGARAALPESLPSFIARVRRRTTLPLAVGFGISTPEQVAQVTRYADAAIVGSALLDLIDRLPRQEMVAGVQTYVRSLAHATRQRGISSA